MAAAVVMSVDESESHAPTRRKQATRPSDPDTIEKDDTERRLEQLLFGDDAGFLDSLLTQTKNAQALGKLSDGNNNTDESDATVRNQLDADAGIDTQTSGGVAASTAVWYDSDDDRVAVSLASNPRLRKLRDTPDDDIVSGREYIARLRRQYERLHPRPEWAMTQAARKRKRQSDNGNGATANVQDDSDLGGSATNGLKRQKLQPEVIDIARLPPVTSSGPSSVESLQFHPYYPILLASGPSATASLYHISPQPPNPNPLLTSLHVKKTALRHSEFCVPQSAGSPPPDDTTTDETRIILSARRRYFHIWTLATGRVSKVSRALSTISQQQKTTERFKTSPSGTLIGLVSSTKAGGGGVINVLDATTLSWICSCRIDSQGGVADFDWWGSACSPSSSQSQSPPEGFTVIGKSGHVSEYSIADRRVVARWHDDGAVGSTVLATSRDGRWTAVGSSAGIVNIYDRHSADFKHAVLAPTTSNSESGGGGAAAAGRPRPARTLDQLTTPISHLVFSPDSQLLVVSSRWKKNALRLVHLPSCTVFRNWPTDSTNLGRISSVAVGGQGNASASMLLAVGNERGAVRLWEIRP
ncbi:hypothetical protein DV735_g3909, partial [Chaetothyriales sp. CBS 134920]